MDLFKPRLGLCSMYKLEGSFMLTVTMIILYSNYTLHNHKYIRNDIFVYRFILLGSQRMSEETCKQMVSYSTTLGVALAFIYHKFIRLQP